MKRILFDVPRWHVYLHRDARGLDRAEQDDTPARRFEDELFDRLYSGEVEALAESDQESSLRSWAEKVHESAEQLPAFERLANECRGDPLAAGMAVETLMEQLKPEGPDGQPPDAVQTSGLAAPNELRRTLSRACDKAAQAVEALRDTLEGLEGVSMSAPGSGTVAASTDPSRDRFNVAALARRLRQDERLKRIALLAGRFKRIAATKRRQRVKHGADEISDVGQGSDLARLLPSEMVRLLRPSLRLAFMRSFTEHQCLEYELTGSETLGRGPLVVCLDKSGSMRGERDVWATAVALALLDHAQVERRPFALLGFDGRVKYETVVQPGQPLPEAGLFVDCGGGTDIGGALDRALVVIRESGGALRKSDVVLITDGESDNGSAPSLREEARRLDVTVLGFGIEVTPSALSSWCDEAHGVSSLEHLDERNAEAMFAR